MLPQGSRIGPYRIEEDLGGTSTEVYRAWDEELRRPVVLKRLPPGADAVARERFHRGAVLAAELDHPSIVRVHALLADAGGAGLLVLELVAGETLARRLEAGSIEAPLAYRLGAQIAAALAAAHERGITHGRLTAERVIVRPDGRAKILGFGPGPDGVENHEHPVADARGDLRALAVLLRQLWGEAGPPAALREWSERLAAAGTPAGAPPAFVDAATVARALSAAAGSGAGTAAAGANDATATAGAIGATAATGTADPAGSTATTSAVGAIGTTGATRAAGGGATTLGAAAAVGVAPRPLRARGRRVRPGRLVLAAGLLSAAVAAGVLWLRSGAAPLAVTVPDPVLAPGSGAETARLSAGLKAALLHTLSDLQGIVPLPSSAAPAAPARGAETSPAPAGKARRRGAAEVLTARLSCRPPTCEIILSRLALGAEGARAHGGAGGGRLRLLWTGTFETPAGRPDLLAHAVESHVRQAYRGFPPRAAARSGG